MRSDVALALILSLAVAGSQAQEHPKGHNGFVTFDAPGASKISPPTLYPLQGTTVVDMNASGEIVGSFTNDSNKIMQTFTRKRDGRILVTDDPSAGTTISPFATQAGTFPYGINDGGDVTGQSIDQNGHGVSFIRSAGGAFADFAAPDANDYYQDSTRSFTINAKGQTAGDYNDINDVSHGFIRNRNGDVIGFEAPDASLSGFWNGTTAVSINKAGAVCGYYLDAATVIHPFLRDPDGTITEFAVPGAGTASYTGAYTSRITDDGTVLGFAYDKSFQAFGFVRFPHGEIWRVNFPWIKGGQGFQVIAINHRGDVLGAYRDANFGVHTLVLFRTGIVAELVVPDAAYGAYQGTAGVNLNDAGEVGGYYIDGNNLSHGFFWSPAGHEE